MLTDLTAVLLMLQAAVSDLPAPSEPPAQYEAAPAAESAAMVEALANKTLIRTGPKFKQEPNFIRPEAARIAGEFGEVVLSGIIGEDGRLTEVSLRVSSKSDIIDAAALAAVPEMLFEPARDATGKPLSVFTNVEIEYSHVDFRGERSVLNYTCEQFVLDYDWWNSKWPADKRDRFYATMRGFATVAALHGNKVFKSNDFGTRWNVAIDDCRKTPTQLMLNVLTPYGAFIREMVSRKI